jgi:3-hexulose-6-phosphate synthase
MKLQISYDFTNLSQALEIAKITAPFADIIEVGTPLILIEGLAAVTEFKKAFPNKQILADAKVVDRVSDIIPPFAKAGASHITFLYGTSNKVIQKATSIAHKNKTKIVLDLIDPETMGQAARDAQALNVDSILFHYPHEISETYDLEADWEMVRGNTDLPIFIAARSAKDINDVIKLKPQGIVVGKAITQADNPEEKVKYYSELLKK